MKPNMMMSERSTSGEDINQKVEEGIKEFEVFQKKLKSIVHALNEQHSSMIELNNNRMKVRLEFLLFLNAGASLSTSLMFHLFCTHHFPCRRQSSWRDHSRRTAPLHMSRARLELLPALCRLSI